jgi:pantothenate kinase-related protein Tda10
MSWAVWITGLPGSGKSVIAVTTAEMLEAWDCPVVVLELDQMVTTRFLHARAPEQRDNRPLGEAGRPRISLDDGTAEQKEISRRAREYLAERLRGAAR